jgi:hypothetical protein
MRWDGAIITDVTRSADFVGRDLVSRRDCRAGIGERRSIKERTGTFAA